MNEGVPQGSILGLIFNIFMNDLFYFVKQGNLFNYADDNSVSVNHEELNVVSRLLQAEAEVTVQWLDKLYHYGIRGTALCWLTNRQQYADIDGIASDKRVITTGVPQGSISGPLLILIYMNDISYTSQLFKFILYADDTTLFSSIEYSLPTYTSNVDLLLNNELINICDWLIINKLSPNISKTKYMVFHPYQKDVSHLVPSLTINDTEIERVNTFNFLGITLDENVSWKPHISILSKRISKYSGILNRLKHHLPLYIMRMLYCSLVNSHLIYGILYHFACLYCNYHVNRSNLQLEHWH